MGEVAEVDCCVLSKGGGTEGQERRLAASTSVNPSKRVALVFLCDCSAGTSVRFIASSAFWLIVDRLLYAVDLFRANAT